jgi:hypothetical protein
MFRPNGAPEGDARSSDSEAVALEPQHVWAISERLHQISSRRFSSAKARSARHRLEAWVDQGALGHVRQQSPRRATS